METITDLFLFFPDQNGCVLTIGVFDGVHLGHRMLFERAREEADRENLELVLLSFSPGPVEFFTGSDDSHYILTVEEFASELEKLGVDRLLLIPFDRALRETRAQDFLDGIVKERLNTKALVVGKDFSFGVGKEGSIEFIERRAGDIELKLIVLDELIVDKYPVRSTTIREMIRSGKIEDANRMLGYRFRVSGEVKPGFGIGESIGCPTANIVWPRTKVKPPRGVYAVITELEGRKYPAVASFGIRPTFDGVISEERFEVHLLDTEVGDLTGKTITSEFVVYIREERKFPSKEELASRIQNDKDKAREILRDIEELERR
jgi:riboflavin kinase/FMN adenylyltransferase